MIFIYLIYFDIVGAQLPIVTSILASSNNVDLEVQMVLEYAPLNIRENVAFVLDGGCQFQACIPVTTFNRLVNNSINVATLPMVSGLVAGGGTAGWRVFRSGDVKICFTTGRGSIRETYLTEIAVGGDDHLLGLQAMTRLGVGQPRDQSGQARIIAVFPIKTPRVV